MTEILSPDASGIARAVKLLSEGGLVAMPTETVYGLGGDARNDQAVARIFKAKNRPEFNPLIVHLADVEAVRKIALWNDQADRLAMAFWPGPLTMVLPLRPDADLSRLVTAGLDTVAVRLPAHPVARDLLRAFGGPVAAPSANLSGRISPTSPAHVLAALEDRIDAVLDAGTCAVGVESTIIGLVDAPILLRPGGLPAEAIEDCLGVKLATPAATAPLSAPGQLASHYAPRARLRLGADAAQPGERLLGFGSVTGATYNLSPTGDLIEAAGNLFEMLHRLDNEGDAPIAVSDVPDHGLGRAINDRLRRAAAPRD